MLVPRFQTSSLQNAEKSIAVTNQLPSQWYLVTATKMEEDKSLWLKLPHPELTEKGQYKA